MRFCSARRGMRYSWGARPAVRVRVDATTGRARHRGSSPRLEAASPMSGVSLPLSRDSFTRPRDFSRGFSRGGAR
eukprot:6689986-Prymnesium_polylepis.1